MQNKKSHKKSYKKRNEKQYKGGEYGNISSKNLRLIFQNSNVPSLITASAFDESDFEELVDPIIKAVDVNQNKILRKNIKQLIDDISNSDYIHQHPNDDNDNTQFYIYGIRNAILNYGLRHIHSPAGISNMFDSDVIEDLQNDFPGLPNGPYRVGYDFIENNDEYDDDEEDIDRQVNNNYSYSDSYSYSYPNRDDASMDLSELGTRRPRRRGTRGRTRGTRGKGRRTRGTRGKGRRTHKSKRTVKHTNK